MWREHEGAFGAALAPGGQFLAVGAGTDYSTIAGLRLVREFQVWSIPEGRVIARLRPKLPLFEEYHFALSPDGAVLATGGDKLTLWNVRQREKTAVIEIPKDTWAEVFSPDGQILAACVGNSVMLWDAASGDEMATIEVPESGHWLTSLAFSRDGSVLAAGGFQKIWLWNTSELISEER